MPYIYGFQPVREALRSRPRAVRRLLISANHGARRRELEALCAESSIAIEETAAPVLASMTDGRHQGFVADLDAEQTLVETTRTGDPDLLVLVEDVQDPRNLGAILRVCEGAGVGRVLIRDRGSAPLSAATSKTAAGAAEWLAIERVTNSSRELERLKEEGFWTYATDSKGAAPWELDLAGKVVICFGGEQKGLRRLTADKCDATIGLPMQGRVDSLNVSTAAAAVLFEIVRQRLVATRD